MGHGNSKSSSSSDDSSSRNGSCSNSKPRVVGSRRDRIKRKLHLHRRHHRGSQHPKLTSLQDFAGIALLTLISNYYFLPDEEAEMKFKDKWLACISIGEQTFRTEISDQTNKPKWNSEKKFLLERNGPHVAKVTAFETNRLSKNNLIGFCEVDLFEFLSRDSDSDTEVFDLMDPSSSNIVVGNIALSCTIEDPIETEKSFARRIAIGFFSIGINGSRKSVTCLFGRQPWIASLPCHHGCSSGLKLWLFGLLFVLCGEGIETVDTCYVNVELPMPRRFGTLLLSGVGCLLSLSSRSEI